MRKYNPGRPTKEEEGRNTSNNRDARRDGTEHKATVNKDGSKDLRKYNPGRPTKEEEANSTNNSNRSTNNKTDQHREYHEEDHPRDENGQFVKKAESEKVTNPDGSYKNKSNVTTNARATNKQTNEDSLKDQVRSKVNLSDSDGIPNINIVINVDGDAKTASTTANKK